MFKTLVDEIGVEETLFYLVKVGFIILAWFVIALVALKINRGDE